MTSFSLVIALIPIIVGTGDGSELRRPITVPIAGGMITSTLLTLVFIPAVYTVLDDMQTKIGGILGRGKDQRTREAVQLVRN
jgi:Cu/Ag efflux pump CusA